MQSIDDQKTLKETDRDTAKEKYMATDTPSPFLPRWVSDCLTSLLFQRQSVAVNVLWLQIKHQLSLKYFQN